MALFEYQGRRVNVVDGDTYDLKLDLGFHITRELRVRLEGIDTHEISGQPRESEEFKRGTEERKFVEAWFDETEQAYEGRWPIIAETTKDRTGKYGRYLVSIRRRADDADLAADLRATFDDIDYE
jgi:endonuclease YncB( thermonuclease family)